MTSLPQTSASIALLLTLAACSSGASDDESAGDSQGAETVGVDSSWVFRGRRFTNNQDAPIRAGNFDPTHRIASLDCSGGETCTVAFYVRDGQGLHTTEVSARIDSFMVDAKNPTPICSPGDRTHPAPWGTLVLSVLEAHGYDIAPRATYDWSYLCASQTLNVGRSSSDADHLQRVE
jgi:hypothetical protein